MLPESSHVHIDPRQVTFLTTNTCTAKCDHCSVHSSPTRRGALTSKQMNETIDQLNRDGRLRVVIFAGGEPTLLGNELLETIAYADSLGLITRMITNAHWATSFQVARERLLVLREAGLRELNISCDDYHIPYIPIKRVKHAWQATRGMGFDAVVIASATGEKSKWTPKAIQALLEEPVELFFDSNGRGRSEIPVTDGSLRVISNSQVSRIGRGAVKIGADQVRLPKRQAELDVPCKWIGGSPAVSPENHLLSCCGMEAAGRNHLDYGELSGDSVETLLRRAEKDLIVQALALIGPFRLMKLLQRLEPTVDFWPAYSAVCEVCAHIFERPEVVKLLEKHADTLSTVVRIASNTSTNRARMNQ